ncbi:MAG: peptidase domain-containing ABC transporter [Clostridia bacterium]|nr:peptidase domain-containing ABC transporter [Clostridia bacterium]
MKYIQQFDETDCGAACISMIASNFKSNISITKIRELACTDKNGTNINGMLIAAKKLGFNARALKGKRENLVSDLPVPFIAHFNIKRDENELLHYVVVKKIKKNYILVFDPDIKRGKKTYPIEEFCNYWTGYCIFISPSNNFQIYSDEKKPLFFKFIHLLKPYTGLLSIVCLISLILSFFGIVGSLYFQYIIDEVLFNGSHKTLFALSIGLMLLTFFKLVLSAIRSYMLNIFSIKVDFNLIFSYFSHVLHLPISFFDTRKTGEILSRMQDAQNIRNALTDATISVVMDTLMVFVVGIVLFFKCKTLFFVSLLVVPLSSLIFWLTAKPFSKQYRKAMEQNAEVQSYLVETMNGGSTVKAMNASEYVFHEYERLQIKSIWTNYKLDNWEIIRNFFTSLINDWGSTIVFWIGSYLILREELSIGELIAFNTLLGYFLGPLNRLLNLQPNLQEAFVAADRLGEILELKKEINNEGFFLKPTTIEGKIDIKNLDFTYGTRRQVLYGINLTINKGEWVAFVGESGSGKTTLLKMLLKFYKPQNGEILLDNNNLEDIDTFYLRSKIGYVPQDIFLFSGTIAENISLHKPDTKMEDIIAAAKKAGAHDFICNQPDRYNTRLSERGSTLSGGERQRIALARALLGNPELLIFDEATSSLDNLSEYNLHQTLKNLRAEKITTIIIAHRLTTVVNCDQIFVLEKGHIVENGKHEQLLKRNGLYKTLWDTAK